MHRSALAFIGCVNLLCSMLACGTPTQATDPRCGTDPGQPNQMYLTCSPTGTTVSCQVRTESNELYCPRVDARDATLSVRWIASNPSVGSFTAPGRFAFTSPGGTAIYAEDARLVSGSAFAFALGHDGVLKEAVPIDVLIASADNTFIPGVIVELTPDDGGEKQRCTSAIGPPYAPCRMWVNTDSPDDRFGKSALVVATKSGYVTVSETVKPKRPPCPVCSPDYVVLRLARATP